MRVTDMLTIHQHVNPQIYSCNVIIIHPVNTKMTIFWDASHCSLLEVYRRFGGTYLKIYTWG